MRVPAYIRDAMSPIVRATRDHRDNIKRGHLYAVTFDEMSDTPLALLDDDWLTAAEPEHPARFVPVNQPARELLTAERKAVKL